MSNFKNNRKFVATVFSLTVAVFLLVNTGSAQPWTVVASGLDNPRGLTFDKRGALLVAEAGIGGLGPCVVGAEGEVCYGPTGAITRVWKGQQARIVSGLPSLAAEDGFGATGPHDISGVGAGNMRVVIGLGNDPAVRSDQLSPIGGAFGRMIQVSASGDWEFVADISGYEASANPDGGAFDSNPYSLISSPGHQVVADAGANAVFRVTDEGISTLAVFPNRMALAPPFLGLPPGAMIPMQAVPNTVALGPDGLYYVGQLTGFPFPVGAARVYRLYPDGTYEIAADGFTNIIDITFDKAGNLYVLEIAKNSLLSGDITGSLIRVAPDGTRTELASAGLVAPSSVAIGPDGGIYVSNFGIFPGAGQVIRLDPGGSCASSNVSKGGARNSAARHRPIVSGGQEQGSFPDTGRAR